MSAGKPRAPGTPEEVRETAESRRPEVDPTLGVPVDTDREGPEPRHRLVALGDSLTHGFKSLGIRDSHLSYPAILAAALGLEGQGFRFPTYAGDAGGLPVDLEWLLRGVEEAGGEDLGELGLFLTVRRLLERKEDFWERGDGALVPPLGGIAHNLAMYGWDLRDALELDASDLRARLVRPRDQILPAMPQNANERAWLRVLDSARDPAGRPLTPLQAATSLGEDGGIETLIVFLGSNNALGTVLTLDARWSGDDFRDHEAKQRYTVWRPSHFDAELAEVAAAVRAVKARHVLWLTIPHVTIAPLAKGIERIAEDSRYFAFYTRPWVRPEHFRRWLHPHLTGAEARDIDRATDQYNEAIVGMVKAARRHGRDWLLVDVSGVLDRLASKRYLEADEAKPSWWEEVGGYALPPELLEALGGYVPTTRFLRSDRHGVTQGGLVSVDGVHPTTTAYAVIAHECMQAMRGAGVRFAVDGLPFADLVRDDTLLTRPLHLLGDTLDVLGRLDARFPLLAVFERAMGVRKVLD